MRAIELTKLRGAVKAKSSLSARGKIRKAHSRDFQSTSHRWEYTEHKCWDPKDGELCLAMLKSGETLMEDRSDYDVQMDRRIIATLGNMETWKNMKDPATDHTA